MRIALESKAVKAGLIGFPVAHSLSSRIFGEFSRRLGRRVVYVARSVPPLGLKDALERLRREGWSGFNVTIPHKQAIIPFLRRLSPEARAIGAVNAARFSGRGLIGHNTDAAGFLDSLRDNGFSARGKEAMVFGAGGAARAVGYALGKAGAARVTFVARRRERGRSLAEYFEKIFSQRNKRNNKNKKTEFRAGRQAGADIWINATPLGMKGFPMISPVPGPVNCGLAYDLVYGAPTPFLSRAAQSGARTMDGLGMLVRQALRSWEFWFGPLAPARRKTVQVQVEEALRCR